nr:MAG TPA: hypothetical protein [Caudoviricetes sp.]
MENEMKYAMLMLYAFIRYGLVFSFFSISYDQWLHIRGEIRPIPFYISSKWAVLYNQ